MRDTLRVALLLVVVSAVVCQYGCQLTQSNCTNNGLCRYDGICTCFKGYIGENCEMRIPYTEYTANLGKGFIAGWVIFWVAVNLLVPYLLYLFILYCRKGNSSEVKEHFWDCYEANCCCIMPPNVRKRRERDRQNVERSPQNTERQLVAGVFSSREGEDPMAPGYNLPSTSSKPVASQMIDTGVSRPVTTAERPRTAAERPGRERDSLMESQNTYGVESRSHLLDSSRLVQTETLLRRQADILKRQNIPRVTDQVSLMQQMYQYEDFDDYDEEALEQEINEEERLLNIKDRIKYKDMISLMYK